MKLLSRFALRPRSDTLSMELCLATVEDWVKENWV